MSLLKFQFILPLLFALLSSIGNALFAFGQKRSEVAANPMLFLVLALVTCISLFLVTLPLFPKVNAISYLHRNYLWILISGIGFYLTFIGFYFLYTHFGTSYYVLYAVLSIITTSIIVGVLIFRESFNLFHALAMGTAIVTVVLFSLGQHMAKGGVS